jgi:Fe2+ transport system protein B
VSVPCVATLAALAGELGWRVAGLVTAATLTVALSAGAVMARLVGVA